MLIYYLAYLPTLVITAGIAIFIYVQNRKNLINKIFSLIILSAFVWNLFNFLTDTSKSVFQALWFCRLAIIGPTFALFLLWYFSTIFPKRYNPLNKVLFLILSIFSAIFLVLFPTSYNVESVSIQNGILSLQAGPLYSLFVIYALIILALLSYNFSKSYRLSRGASKVQITYLLLGAAFTIIFGLLYNGVLPLIGIKNLGGLGSISVLFFIGFTTYSVARYRFLDVKLVIRRRIIYPIVLVAAVFLYAVGFLYIGNKLAVHFPAIVDYIYFAAIFLGALIFDTIKNWISKTIDKYLFVAPYNREEIVNQLDNLLRQSADFNINNKLVIGALRVRMRLNKVIFVALDREIHNLAVEETSRGIVHEKRYILPHIITNYLKKNKQALVYEELKREIEDGILKETKLLKEIEKIKAYVVVPILINRQLTGILILGEKQSGDAFTVEDIRMFDDLAYRIGRSMESSSLYRQIERQKKQLSRNYGDLKKVMDITIGRELKMAELKKKIQNDN